MNRFHYSCIPSWMKNEVTRTRLTLMTQKWLHIRFNPRTSSSLVSINYFFFLTIFLTAISGSEPGLSYLDSRHSIRHTMPRWKCLGQVERQYDPQSMKICVHGHAGLILFLSWDSKHVCAQKSPIESSTGRWLPLRRKWHHRCGCLCMLYETTVVQSSWVTHAVHR